MGKLLYLECNSGISGDMTVGALLDLGADREVLVKALNSLGVDGYRLQFGRAVKHGIDAFDFDVVLEEEEEGYHTHERHESECHIHGDHEPEYHAHGEHGPESHTHGEHGSESHTHGDHDPEHHTHEEHSSEHHAHGEHDPEYYTHEEHDLACHTHGSQDSAHHIHHDHGHDHHHGSSHVHRNLADIYEIIGRLNSKDSVKDLARTMFRIVAEAESKAHGLPLGQVHFHEVGAVDSIVDIVSVAVCLDDLGVDEVVVSPLSEGRGHIHCQHGILPVPVPATANIAAAYGLELHLTDNDGEMVTPTGAAIAAAVRTRKKLPKACRILKIGIGAGKREYKQSNILRAMLLESDELTDGETKADGSDMWVVETNLDDCSGENLGFVMECLMEEGAADVWYTPVFMKKNRPAYLLSVLCSQKDIEKMETVILTQTTTIGIRKYGVERTVLPRHVEDVDTVLGKAQVKICRNGDSIYCYPEYESVRRICLEKKMEFQTVYHIVKEEAVKKWRL